MKLILLVRDFSACYFMTIQLWKYSIVMYDFVFSLYGKYPANFCMGDSMELTIGCNVASGLRTFG